MSHQEAVQANIKAFTDADRYDNMEPMQTFSSLFARTLLQREITFGGTFGDLSKPNSGITTDGVEGNNLDGKKVMEFACGTGLVSRKLIPHMSKGSQLDGVDINDVFLKRYDEVTKPLSRKQGVEVNSYKVDILDPEMAKTVAQFEGQYDVIFCTISYHHLHNYEQVTAKLATFLRPGGYLYIIDFYNPDVEADLERESDAYAVQHMGGLKKSALHTTLTAAGLENINVQHLFTVNSWFLPDFIKTHQTKSQIEALAKGELESKESFLGTAYAVPAEFVIAIGQAK